MLHYLFKDKETKTCMHEALTGTVPYFGSFLYAIHGTQRKLMSVTFYNHN